MGKLPRERGPASSASLAETGHFEPVDESKGQIKILGCPQRVAGRVMMTEQPHRVYRAIVEAWKRKRLREPFTKDDFREACPGFGDGTYNAFLHKHRRGNPAGTSELFELVAPGRFRLLRPLRYGLGRD